MPERELRYVGCLARFAYRVLCKALSTAIRGAGYRGTGGIQAQCVGRGGTALSESVVNKISGQRSLRLSDPTNDVTAHVGRIRTPNKYDRPHRHTWLRAFTQVTRKPFRHIIYSECKHRQDFSCKK